MSKFKAGDRVKIVALTDVDDRRVRLTDDRAARASDPFLGGLIGRTATIKEPICDYYDYVITMDEQDDNYPEFNEMAMLECDLEAVK